MGLCGSSDGKMSKGKITANSRFDKLKLDEIVDIKQRSEKVKLEIDNVDSQTEKYTEKDERHFYLELLTNENSLHGGSIKEATARFDALKFAEIPNINARYQAVLKVIGDTKPYTPKPGMLSASGSDVYAAPPLPDSAEENERDEITEKYYMQLLTQLQDTLGAAIKEARQRVDSLQLDNEANIAQRFQMVQTAITGIEALNIQNADERAHYEQLLIVKQSVLQNVIDVVQVRIQQLNLNGIADIAQRFQEVQAAITGIAEQNILNADERAHYQQSLEAKRAALQTAMQQAQQRFNDLQLANIANIATRFQAVQAAITGIAEQNILNAEERAHYEQLLTVKRDALQTAMQQTQQRVDGLQLGNIANIVARFQAVANAIDGIDALEIVDVNERVHYNQLLEAKQNALQTAMQQAQQIFDALHLERAADVKSRFLAVNDALLKVESVQFESPEARDHYAQLLQQAQSSANEAVKTAVLKQLEEAKALMMIIRTSISQAEGSIVTTTVAFKEISEIEDAESKQSLSDIGEHLSNATIALANLQAGEKHLNEQPALTNTPSQDLQGLDQTSVALQNINSMQGLLQEQMQVIQTRISQAQDLISRIKAIREITAAHSTISGLVSAAKESHKATSEAIIKSPAKQKTVTSVMATLTQAEESVGTAHIERLNLESLLELIAVHMQVKTTSDLETLQLAATNIKSLIPIATEVHARFETAVNTTATKVAEAERLADATTLGESTSATATSGSTLRQFTDTLTPLSVVVQTLPPSQEHSAPSINPQFSR